MTFEADWLDLSEFDLTEDEEKKLIDNIAKLVVDRGLEAPAIMFLEATRPLSFIRPSLQSSHWGRFNGCSNWKARSILGYS